MSHVIRLWTAARIALLATSVLCYAGCSGNSESSADVANQSANESVSKHTKSEPKSDENTNSEIQAIKETISEAERLRRALEREAVEVAKAMDDFDAAFEAGERAREAVAEAASAEVVIDADGIAGEDFQIAKGAKDLSRDADLEMITYNTTAIKPHAKFYNETLARLGWKTRGEQLIENDMGILKFQKGNGTIDISMLFDDRRDLPVRVIIQGDGLIWPVNDEYAAHEAEGEFVEETTGETEGLVADDFNGFPVPRSAGDYTSGGSQFRKEFQASIECNMPELIEFCREQFEMRGLKEDTSKAKVADNKATLAFHSDDEQLDVTLEQFGDEIDIKIDRANLAAVKEAGLLPPAGKVRIVLANASKKEVKFTLGGKTYKVAAGKGMEDPKDGVMVDVKAGSHSVAYQMSGKSTKRESFQSKNGQCWGVIVIPTGQAMSMNLY